MRCRSVFAFLLLAVSVSALSAEELVFVKGAAKPLKTTIKKETAQGLQTAAKDIAPEDVIDIEYELNPLLVRTGIYRKARESEKDSLEKEGSRKSNIASALTQYEETLTKMAPGQAPIRRNIEYRVAVLKARQALELGSPAEAAIQKLSDFAKSYPDSWQIAPALRLLANVQVSQKNFADAEKTYTALKAAPVSEDVKSEAEFLAAHLSMQAGNHAQALNSMRSLAQRLPKDNKFGMRARVAEAECLSAAKKTVEANKLLQDILKEGSDKTLKAMAYNTLGVNLFNEGQLKEARWEFLWVDVVYFQDKNEHAKALYYLSQIFDKLGEADRAAECRELLNDRQFAGLEYQRKAQTASK